MKTSELLEARDAASAEVERLRAGGDETPARDDTERTPGQLWAWLLSSAPAERIGFLEHVQTARREAMECFVQGHKGRLAELERKACALLSEQYEVDQILGKALGCPEGFPVVNLVDDGSVVTGEHTTVSLAHAAAKRITEVAP